MAEIDTSIYRPQQQPNPLDQITKVGQAAGALGDIEAGKAVQGAMGPDGQIDRNALARLITQNVAGSMKAIPTLNALETLKSAGFAADQAGLETFQKRMAITHHLFSGLASKDKPTMADVNQVAAQALDPALEAKKYGITLPVIMNALKQFRGPDGKPLSSEQIKRKALEIQTQAASTSEVLSQHSPGYFIADQGGQLTLQPAGTKSAPAIGTAIPKTLPPGTPVMGPNRTPTYLGEQPAVPGGGAVGPSGQPIVPPPMPPANVTVGPRGVPGAPPKDQARAPGGPPVPTGPASGLPVGQAEAFVALAADSARSSSNLTAANDTSMVRKGMLGNLEDDLTKFTSGKGADWTLVAKNFINRNIPHPESWQKAGAVLDPKSIASQEQFNKQAVQLAQAQFAAIGGTGTDAKFSSAFETSPNETLSELGNKGIIKLLKGNEDAIQAKNAAWLKYKKVNGPDSYPEFSAEFNEAYDPRVFQFRYLTIPERNAYIAAMDQEDRDAFTTALGHAFKQKWVRFDMGKK